MPDELAPVPTSLTTRRAKQNEAVREYVDASTAANTRRAYRSDWQDFEVWCAAHYEQALPAAPETVARYLTDLAKVAKAATLDRRLSSISMAHQFADLETPTRTVLVRKTMKGIRRQKVLGREMVTQKEAAVTAIVRDFVAVFPDTPTGLRNKALILIGFAGAFRRSELVALDMADLKFSAEGVVITVRQSKTDQEGEGTQKGIPYGRKPMTCPVRALRAWLDAADIVTGPVFRPIDRHGNIKPQALTAQSVALIVKQAAGKAGYDPTVFAGHSLRAGLATAAAQAGVSERIIMAQTGHKSVTVARRYIRRGELFSENAAADVGL